MRLLSRVFILLALFILPPVVWAVDVVSSPTITQPLTVDDAISLAFKYNPDLRIATNQINKSVGVIEEAKANFNPSFSVQATQLFQNKQSFTLPLPGIEPIAIETAVPLQTTTQISGLLPLDISNRLRYTTDIAKYQFQINYFNLLRVSEQLIFNVKSAYYNLLRACGQAQANQSAVDVAAVRLKNTRARFTAGTVPKFDVTTAETDLANLNQQLISSQSRVNITQANLNRVMGINVTTPTQVVTPVIPVDLSKIDIVSANKQAKEQRPEVKAQQVSIALNEKNIKLQRTGYFPTLSLGSGFGYNIATSTTTTTNTNWNVNLNLNIPIWDGGVTRARIHQAEADAQTAIDTLDQTQISIGFEVSNAALTLEEAALRTQTTAQAVALAEEALRLANVRYAAGIATQVEVTNAESQLTTAKFNLVNAQYDYAIAVADLERATSNQPELSKLRLLDCLPRLLPELKKPVPISTVPITPGVTLTQSTTVTTPTVPPVIASEMPPETTAPVP